jgi:CheY-like chemotaxis protein
MAGSFVVCKDCGDSSAAVEWGFVLLARHGWSAQLGEAGSEPAWRCPSCNSSVTSGDTWDAEFAISELETSRRRLRVLLVDDQVLVLRATAGMLRELDVVTASSGAEALARLAEGSHFDVIVSDVAMPGINGPELYARVKANYPQLAERFLLLSGDSYGASALCAVVARRERLQHMPPIIDKPVPRDMLVREIQALGRRNLPRSGTFAISAEVPAIRTKAK